MAKSGGTDGRRRRAAGAPPDRAAVVGHELRGPLGVVATVADLLLSHDLSAEDRHLVALVRLAGAQALAVADDLVADAGLGADRFRVVSAPFDPAATLRAIAALWAPQFAGDPDRLALDVGPDAPASLVGDESRVRQILFNLVSNAAKAAPDGRVTLSLAGDGAGGAVYAVADDGPGLDAGFAPEPFAGADRPLPGAGLGLWISCRIADALSGRLSVENRPAGGAVARLALPAAPPAAASPPATRSRTRRKTPAQDPAPSREPPMTDAVAFEPPARVSPLAGLRALVVDDSAVSRLLMETILDSFDMRVETAAGGAEAEARVLAHRPDLVVLDWSLARETGADVLDRLEVVLGGDLPPVISVTADARRLHGRRVAAHVLKPFTPRELHAALETAVLAVRTAAAAG